MFRAYSQDQMMLLPPSLKDFVDETHPVHLINDMVEKLDLSVLERRYGDMGQPAYHPRIMLKVILYGFSVGVFSARKLARACRENLAFQYLSGGERPAFKTFVEFRARHRQDMREVFLQTVKLAQELGLKKLGNVALDGTKIEADTSKHKAMSHGRMEKEEERLKEEITGLLRKAEEMDSREDHEFGADKDGYSLEEELAYREVRLMKIAEAKAALETREKRDHPDESMDPKKQISFADPEARCFGKKGSGGTYVYNAQAAVDMQTQVIVENHIEDSTHDAQAAKSSLENMKKGLDQTPEVLVADSAYANETTIEACRKQGVTPVCALPKASCGRQSQARSQGETPAAFNYDEKANAFTCIHGLRFEWDHDAQGSGASIYLARSGSACACRVGASKKGSGILRIEKKHLAQREFQRNLQAHLELYALRKVTIEPVFGQIKTGMGFRRFLYRSLKKVGSEWNLVCAAFNLKKMSALIRKRVFAPPAPTGCPRGRHAFEISARIFWTEMALCRHLLQRHMALLNNLIVQLAHCT